MGKPWRNKKRVVPADGRCSHPGCDRRADVKHECRTCEQLVKAGKRKEIVVFRGCRQHAMWSTQKIQSHVLRGHPVNIFRACVAALRGEGVF